MSEQHEQSTESTVLLPTGEESTAQKRSTRKPEPSQYETAMIIADRLGEQDERRRQYIVYLVRALGRTQARKLLHETLQTQEQDSETAPDEEAQRRTPSEVFFHLAQTRGQPKHGKVLGRFGSPQIAEEQSGLPSHQEVAQQIAEKLGETGEPQRRQIEYIVWALGQVQAWAIMLDALELDADEGMMTPDGSRRRTVGGIFFYLVYERGKPEEGKILNRFSHSKRKKPKAEAGQAPKQPQPQTAKAPPFVWEDRIALITNIGERGIATAMKITLIGTLGKYEERGTCIVGVMQSGEKVPALPKGVPAPQPTKTNYVVYIGAKQWKNVAAAASDPEDSFIIEGYPQIDAQTNAISVFATNITSKKLQAAKRQSQG